MARFIAKLHGTRGRPPETRVSVGRYPSEHNTPKVELEGWHGGLRVVAESEGVHEDVFRVIAWRRDKYRAVVETPVLTISVRKPRDSGQASTITVKGSNIDYAALRNKNFPDPAEEQA